MDRSFGAIWITSKDQTFRLKPEESLINWIDSPLPVQPINPETIHAHVYFLRFKEDQVEFINELG
uniref:Uncharacterized protein n=1 Tax=Tetranychus urticae TaxID=32264 RepID=T1KKN6_TETUR